MPWLRRPTVAFALALMASLLPSAALGQVGGQLRCQAGVADDYATADGVETASPSSALEVTLGTLPDGAPWRMFDQCSRNYDFVHTVSTCALDSGLTRAVLTLRLRGTPSGETQTDRLVLGSGGTLRWGMLMNTLQSLRTGGADGTWSSTDSATFVLDLGNLPPSQSAPSGWPSWMAGTTNILPFLAEGGDLDIVLRDDTCVDALFLQVDSTTPARPVTWGSVKASYR